MMDYGDIVLGFRLGCTTMLLIWVLWDVFVDASARPTQNLASFKAVVPVYRSMACLIALVWLWFANLTVFKAARINHMFLLDIDSRLALDRRAVLQEASTLSIVFLADFLFYFKALRKDGFSLIPPNYFPVALCAYVGYKLVFPLELRKPFWKTTWEVVTAPFSPLAFRHGYVADVFTSMVKVLADLAYTLCFVSTGDWSGTIAFGSCADTPFYTVFVIPLAHSLPLWWRFMQTIKQYRDTRSRWPYLGNAFKYAFAQSVIMFGVFKPHLRNPLTDDEVPVYQAIWILTFVCSTLYSFWWDVVMDWGLGVAEFGYLREKLLFKRRSIYLVVCVCLCPRVLLIPLFRFNGSLRAQAIFTDLCLRFCWTFSLIPAAALPNYLAKYMDFWMVAFLEFAELFRRAMWGCFRLEWEEIVKGDPLPDVQKPPTGGSAFQERSPPLDGQRVVLEIALFVVGVLSICVVAALT